MDGMTIRGILLSSLVVFLVLVAPAAAVRADKPNPTFAGRIMLSDKHFPVSAKSLAAFNGQVKKQSKTSFFEDKDKKWKIFFAAFLKKPLDDIEYVVKLYELSGRSQRLVATIEQFTDVRGQATLLSNLMLERSALGANKELLMTVEYKGKVLASTRFKILGQQEELTGKADFTDEETGDKKPADDE